MLPENQVPSPLPSPKKPRDWHWLPGVIVSGIFIVIAVLGFLFRQAVIDRFTVMNYSPSASIAKISSDASLSEEGKFYFYASRPEINSSDTFNLNCVQQEVTSVILGCYTAQRIYIYDVKNNETLSGVKTVTAAHEMLHAAWERLSIFDKNRLSDLLLSAYDRVKTEELVTRMGYYERNQPGEQVQELHSILATEFSNLGPELEEYYSRYFVDRQAVVEIHAKYSAIINDIESRRNALKQEIDALNTQLTSMIDSYNSDVATINSKIAALEVERQTINVYDTTAVNAFNKKRAELLAQVEALKARKVSIESMQDTYNNKVEEYNKLVLTGNELSASLNSTLQKTPDIAN